MNNNLKNFFKKTDNNTLLVFITNIATVILWFVFYTNYVVHNEKLFPIFLFIPNLLIFLSFFMYNLFFSLIYGGLLLVMDITFYFINENIFQYNYTIKFGSVASIMSVLFLEIFILAYYNRLQIEKKAGELAIGEQEEQYNVLSDDYKKNLEKNNALKEELNRMEKLSHTSTILGSYFDSIDDIIANIVKETKKILKYSNVLFSVYDNEKKQFIIKESIGYDKKFIGKPTDNIDEWLMVLKSSVIIDDIENDGRIKVKKYTEFSKGKSLIASPVIRNHEVYGILRIESPKRNSFTPDDLRVLSYITDMASIVIENNFYYKKVEQLAITDGITGLYIQKYFFEKLEIEINRYFKNKIPLSLIMIDIDNFKEINDNYGHPFGDKTLITVAQIIKKNLRNIDFPARYGGDEFAIILPHTELKGAVAVGKRLFESIESIDLNDLSKDKIIHHNITVSIGIGEFKAKYKDSKTFIKKIDEKLYYAKRKGKNRIEILK